jgi:hypothetical protein
MMIRVPKVGRRSSTLATSPDRPRRPGKRVVQNKHSTDVESTENPNQVDVCEGERHSSYDGPIVDRPPRGVVRGAFVRAFAIKVSHDPISVRVPVVNDPSAWTRRVKLVASDGHANDALNRPSISGDVIVIGAWGDDNKVARCKLNPVKNRVESV